MTAAPHRLLAAVVDNLRVDAMTAEVMVALKAAGVRAVLLKGPGVARWLYDAPGERRYVDTDLLVAPGDRPRAEEVLRGLGLTTVGRGWMGGAGAWAGRGRAVDLHVSLLGITVGPEAAWRVLSRTTERIPVGGVDVEILAPAARLFHVATHAAQHPFAPAHPLHDLERAFDRLPEEMWEAAAAFARQLRSEAIFAAGVRRHPDGAALLARLAIQAPDPVVVTLLSSEAPRTALSFAQLAAAAHRPGLLLSLLMRAVVPAPTRVIAEEPSAAGRPVRLVLWYLRRLWHLARDTPDGYRAYRAAVRRSREAGGR